MKICMVTTFYPPYHFGGDGVFIQRLSNGLAQRGHDVEVVHCADSFHILRLPLLKSRPDHPAITVHTLKSPFGFFSPLATQQTGFPFFKAKQLRQIFSRGFDVIHYHNISLVGGPAVLGFGEGIKLYSPHEYWLVCRNHNLFRNNSSICSERQCFRCDLIHRRPPPLWRYTNMLESSLRHVDAFLASTRFVIRMHQQLGLHNLPFFHLPHFAPKETCLSHQDAESTALHGRIPGMGSKPYFLYVGRLEPFKGIESLLPIFRRWSRASLLIAGSGSQERELRRRAHGAGNVVFLGHMESAELAGLYRGAISLIIPSVCHEMSALVSLEAMAHGTPVISRSVGGMTELVEETKGGVVYETDDELVPLLDRMLDDPAYRRQLSENGREACRTHRSLDAHIDNYLDIIKTISVHKKSSGHPIN